MPTYKFKCPNCEDVFEIKANFDEYETVKKSRCPNPECDSKLVRIYHQQSAQVFLPAEKGFTRVGFI